MSLHMDRFTTRNDQNILVVSLPPRYIRVKSQGKGCKMPKPFYGGNQANWSNLLQVWLNYFFAKYK